MLAQFKLSLPTEGQSKDIIASIEPVRNFFAELDSRNNLTAVDLTPSKQAVGGRIGSLVVIDIDDQLPNPLGRLYVKYLSARQLLDSGMVARTWTILSALIRDAKLIGRKDSLTFIMTSEYIAYRLSGPR